MAQYAYVYINHAYLQTEAHCLVTYVITAVLNDCYSEVTAYTALAYSVFMMCMDAKVKPIHDTGYN